MNQNEHILTSIELFCSYYFLLTLTSFLLVVLSLEILPYKTCSYHSALTAMIAHDFMGVHQSSLSTHFICCWLSRRARRQATPMPLINAQQNQKSFPIRWDLCYFQDSNPVFDISVTVHGIMWSTALHLLNKCKFPFSLFPYTSIRNNSKSFAIQRIISSSLLPSSRSKIFFMFWIDSNSFDPNTLCVFCGHNHDSLMKHISSS